MSAIRHLYGRIIRTPIIGVFLRVPVRFVKRLFGLPTAQEADRIEMLQAALAGLKTENEWLAKRVEALEFETRRQRQYDHQLTTMVELLSARQDDAKTKSSSRSRTPASKGAKTRTSRSKTSGSTKASRSRS